jgi:hypothetical protein
VLATPTSVFFPFSVDPSDASDTVTMSELGAASSTTTFQVVATDSDAKPTTGVFLLFSYPPAPTNPTVCPQPRTLSVRVR